MTISMGLTQNSYKIGLTTAFQVSLLLAVMVGCVSDQQKRSAVRAVNEVFRVEYEAHVAREGTKFFAVAPVRALELMRRTLVDLDMVVTGEDADLGYLQVAAPAPKPLTEEDWKLAVETDGPIFRETVVREAGLAGYLADFEPEGLDVVIDATVVPKNDGSSISLTMRFRETAPPQTDFPRREYPPPTAIAIGTRKIWARFRELLNGDT